MIAETGCDPTDPVNNAAEEGNDRWDAPAQAQSDPVQTPAASDDPSSPRAARRDAADADADDLTDAWQAVEPEPALEQRRSGRGMMVYAKPDFSAAFRGKIPRGEVFDVVEHVEGGPDCRRDGWARLGVNAYACLERAEVVDETPRSLPVVRPGRLMPFYYARRRKTDDPPPRWRSAAAIARGEDPVGVLDLDHDYAFMYRRRRRSGTILTDRGFGAVRESDVRRLAPSAFEGRDLLLEPVAEGKTLAWVVAWPYAEGFATPKDTEKRTAKLRFQSQLYVKPEPTVRRGVRYFQVDDGAEKPVWVAAKQIRVVLGAAPPPDITDDQPWIDVDLGQQTLTLMRGAEPEYTTLVSSGSHKHPTPVGLYRITSKHGFGDMRSRPSDSDEAYHVEAVPWIMYFKGRYALHGAFWHNRFGHRMSHGCVNLSAKDAARIFETTAPRAPGGWLSVYEATNDEGTLLRVRKGTAIPPDRRRPPRQSRPGKRSARN